jgi:hypothetical protein
MAAPFIHAVCFQVREVSLHKPSWGGGVEAGALCSKVLWAIAYQLACYCVRRNNRPSSRQQPKALAYQTNEFSSSMSACGDQ